MLQIGIVVRADHAHDAVLKLHAYMYACNKSRAAVIIRTPGPLSYAYFRGPGPLRKFYDEFKRRCLSDVMRHKAQPRQQVANKHTEVVACGKATRSPPPSEVMNGNVGNGLQTYSRMWNKVPQHTLVASGKRKRSEIAETPEGINA